MTSKTRAEGIIQHPLVVWLRLRAWISSTFIPPLCRKFSQYFVCVLWIWSRHLNHKCSIMPYIQYGSSEAYLPGRMVISEGCGSLPWNVPVLCSTFSTGTSCEYAFKGALGGKWACYMCRKEGVEGWLGKVCTQLPCAGRAAQCACVSGDVLMTWLSRTYTKYKLSSRSYSAHSIPCSVETMRAWETSCG